MIRRTLILVAALACTAAAQQTDRPNVVLIVSDDPGWAERDT